ncbi:MAG TPA: TetR/AcrR family transcriptional regulator [Phototrophicaceae bacterium]|nr:TetR/AcrR family transcriptional regulator [Phototrophicaceae bacterium]
MTRQQRLREGSQKRREQQKEDLSQLILKAAGEIFLRRGYEGFSLRQVAEEIGYSPGTIYLYFANKDDLLRALAHQGFDDFSRMLETVSASSADPLDRMIALWRGYVVFGLQNPAFYRLIFMERPDFFVNDQAENAPKWEEAFAIWSSVMNDAVRAGKIRADDPVKTSDAIWSALHGIVALANRMPDFTAERALGAADAAIEMIIKGLRP